MLYDEEMKIAMCLWIHHFQYSHEKHVIPCKLNSYIRTNAAS